MLLESLERPTTASASPPLPYPGLRPFEEAESRIFFGRETEIRAVLRRLEEQQLVVVHGASGCGKSSVVRAGVIPTFRRDALASGAKAKVIIIRPSDPGGPIASLAAALEREFPDSAARPLAEAEGGDTAQPAATMFSATPSWSERLVASPRWRSDLESTAAGAGATLCLIIDQFEEIFALHRKGAVDEVARVIEFLISLDERAPAGTALGGRPLSVILTMRSDYIGHCSLWDGFAETVNRCQYLLPKMSTLGLLRAIHQPPLRYGGSVDEPVADHLLPVMAAEIDGLPILAHALMRSWQVAKPGEDGRRIVKLDHLNKIGGVAKALSKHAEEAFERATGKDPARIEAAEWIFRALCDLDADGRIIRRSVTLNDLIAETGAEATLVCEIVEVFRQPEFSFVTPCPPLPLDKGSNISVTHEALLRRWERISSTLFDEEARPVGLVYREFIDGMIWRALAVQAGAFDRNSGLILSAAATEQRLPWYREIAKRPGWTMRHRVRTVFDRGDRADDQWFQVAALMAASEENLEREQSKLEAERANVAKLRKSRKIITALAAVVVLLGAWVAWMQISEAREERQKALSALELSWARSADDMARRACQGRERADDACLQSEARRFYNEIKAMESSTAAESNQARATEVTAEVWCRGKGLAGQALNACISQQAQQYSDLPMSPYSGGLDPTTNSR